MLATPDGMAAAWRWVQSRYRSIQVLARRVFRRSDHAVIKVGAVAGSMTMSGTGYVERWQPWRKDATGDERIDILHRQIDFVHEQIGELRVQIQRTAESLQKEWREADDKIIGQLRQLASEMRGERSQASRVDARGLGPIALGIIMTGLADELAAVVVVGWLVILVAVIWIGVVFPSWLRDYKQALKYSRR
jgi:hypothetical protein